MRQRPLLIGLGIVAAVAAVGWFSVSQSSERTTTGAMTTMTTSPAGPGGGMGRMGKDAMKMDGSAPMGGMIPLVAGADGTKPTAAGLTLRTGRAVTTPGRLERWQLRVTRADGTVVTAFERDQTKLMHLIVVRSDVTGYQHLHPTLGADGVFTVGLRLPKAGTYRAIADFVTAGKRYALGVPVKVRGSAPQTPVPGESMTAETDGYSVMMMRGTVAAGSDAQLDFTVARDGQAVKALLPYLGAYGHLVALRVPTLAYSHVHPTTSDRARGMIGFNASFPRSGTYRLFLQFRTASGVHTAPFTVKAG